MKTPSFPITAFVLSLTLVGAGLAQPRPKLYSKDAPVRLDFDMKPIKKPATYEAGYLWDFGLSTFGRPVKRTFDLPRQWRNLSGHPLEAFNVNTLDEVPDSSWFTNRIGRRAMTIDEIKRGPNRSDGPAPGRLTVTKGKTNGVTPGFQVRDERGDVYLLKFDPLDYPELSSAAEAISTRLFYAIGYNVPENNVFHFRREQLVPDPKAEFKDQTGALRQFTDRDIDEILKLAAKGANGEYRCLASKFVEGKPIGNFLFTGTRPDDPNDTIPHEHRRDLRALDVFSAWLNHNDIRNGNTLDTFVKEDGREFVRHYLIDFGSTLGSGSTKPNDESVGYAYIVDGEEMVKTLFSLGIYQPHWRDGKNPIPYKSVGNFTAEHFVPQDWKPDFPVAAFSNMTDRDAYWAAKIVGAFTDEQIRAAVETGMLTNPQAAAYLTEQLIKRRDAIVREYLPRRAALDELTVQRGRVNATLENATQSGAAVIAASNTTGGAPDGWTLLFRDLRAPLTPRAEPDYEYELAAAADTGKKLARGRFNTTQLYLAPDLLQQVASLGNTPENRGVARLRLKRKGESRATTAWLFYDDARGQLRLIGQQN